MTVSSHTVRKHSPLLSERLSCEELHNSRRLGFADPKAMWFNPDPDSSGTMTEIRNNCSKTVDYERSKTRTSRFMNMETVLYVR
jgi:hypothetical protein